MSMSLMKILNDPSLLFDNERIKKKIEDVKKDKQGIVNAANSYNDKYEKEIREGTLKRQVMIEDGRRMGLKEDDAIKGSFVPTKYTPILNWLYFMMREENADVAWEENRRKFNKEFGHLEHDYDYKDSGVIEEPKELDVFIYGNMTSQQFQTVKKLKTLALSPKCNENESALAFSMCKQMCQKFGLEFDKIPTNN